MRAVSILKSESLNEIRDRANISATLILLYEIREFQLYEFIVLSTMKLSIQRHSAKASEVTLNLHFYEET